MLKRLLEVIQTSESEMKVVAATVALTAMAFAACVGPLLLVIWTTEWSPVVGAIEAGVVVASCATFALRRP